MPPVQEDQSFYAKTDAYIFYAMSVGGWLMRWLFLIGIILGIGRMVVIGILALAQYLRSRRRERIHFGESFEPLVSVVVPAFNEEKVICRTIESLLASDYPKLEIIVVDDGSTDDTYLTAMEAFGDVPNVSVYTKPNGGKAEALNFGWRKAKGEIIIALDADTLFHAGDGLGPRSSLCRRKDRRHRRQRKGRQSREHRHKMAGARICHVAEF